jgi:threonine/homoserine/homoserine lactone efflux protein
MTFPGFTQVVTGSTLGLFAGLSPGPMLTLVLTQTLQYSAREGIKVAAAPLITDPPIIAAAWLLFSQVSDIEPLLGLISCAGAVYLGFLGLEAFRVSPKDTDITTQLPKSLAKGVLTNFLNPHPYMFWFSVGIPMLTTPRNHQVIPALLFLTCFYLLLVGSKMSLALIVARGKSAIQTRVYPWIMKVLGCALWVFGLLFLVKGLRILLWP